MWFPGPSGATHKSWRKANDGELLSLGPHSSRLEYRSCQVESAAGSGFGLSHEFRFGGDARITLDRLAVTTRACPGLDT